ncbi:MAG: hypothetical protein ACXVB4_14090 [Pseudobdellovibrionaceae bacterium]
MKIYQSPSEPSRKNFTDSKNLDIIVWFENSNFDKIVGFQISYKENPFDTDNEFFITYKKTPESPESLKLGRTSPTTTMHPANKMIKQVSDRPPNSFFLLMDKALRDLPKDIRVYVEKIIRKI